MADNQADTPSLPEGQPERSREAAPEMDSIMEGFSRLLREGKEVKVLTFYKGVPIWYGAPVTSTGDESVTLKVHRYQSFALELRKEAYLKSDTHSKVLHANVDDPRRRACCSDDNPAHGYGIVCAYGYEDCC